MVMLMPIRRHKMLPLNAGGNSRLIRNGRNSEDGREADVHQLRHDQDERGHGPCGDPRPSVEFDRRHSMTSQTMRASRVRSATCCCNSIVFWV
jgi:hypothetical protein